MDVKECYEAMEADYDGVMGRLLKEDRVKKYLLKFAQRDDYQQLELSLKEGRYQDAFRHAHDLKGNGLNLGLVKLYTASDVLCEALRGKDRPDTDITGMVEAVRDAYNNIQEAVSGLD